MKQIPLIVLLTVALTARGQGPSAPEAVEAQIEALREVIIPTKGTPKAEVEAVYGVGRETKELRGKGSAVHYPMHSYNLLPAKRGQDFRAFLYVTYREGKVHYVGINHICVVKNRVINRPAIG